MVISIIIVIEFSYFSAIQAEIVGRETDGEMVKFLANVQAVYKRGVRKIPRGEQSMWVSMHDLTCKCPKVRLHRRYLIISNDAATRDGGVTLDEKSIVIPWRDEWQNRVRRFQKMERKGRC